jgi:hypothetical protein
VFADLVDGDDVWVLECGGCGGLFPEAGAGGFPGELAAEEEFYGDDPAQAALAGAEDDSHAAAGDFTQEFIVTHDLERD